MDVKGPLKAISLELRWELEGKYDPKGAWQPADLERRLAAIGVRRDRPPVSVHELSHLSPEDREARRVVDAFLQSRAEAGQSREAAIAEFVRDAAYTWANRLVALRCMEARGLIDEVILQKDTYGGRSLQHNRLAKKQPERCGGEDEGLFAALFDEFARRSEELPLLFDPHAPEVALRPSVAALKRCIAILSGTIAVKGQDPATDEVFTAPDALGWAYQFWNTEEKDRVFEKVRTKKGSKIEGAEIIPATCIYTEPYMVKFLVQNSLGAIWMGMHPDSRLVENWDYFVRGADRAPVANKPVAEITFLDPACGSGHFLIEAFELFYEMYLEECALTNSAEICASILKRNLYGIDIDERAVQIAALALVMKAKEKAPEFVPRGVNLVATNIRMPAGKEHLEAFLRKHSEDAPLKPALLAIFEGLAHADELGSLLQIEEPVERELRHLREQQLARERKVGATSLFEPRKDEDWPAWKHEAIERLLEHFNSEVRDSDLTAAFFGEAASKGLSLVDLLARRYDVVAANPPYMGSRNMGSTLRRYIDRHFSTGKRDLYSAFMLRAVGLASANGRIAMVTQQSWMFQSSFANLRRVADTEASFLGRVTLECLGHVGPRGFSEVGGEVVNTVLFVASHGVRPNAVTIAISAVAGDAPEAKAAALRVGQGAHVYTFSQTVFARLPGAPLAYWLTPRHQEVLAKNPSVGEILTVVPGLKTGSDFRFLRFHWEVPPTEVGFLAYSKGGGGCERWYGQTEYAVDWRREKTPYREYKDSRQPYSDYYLSEGFTYSAAAKALGVRQLPPRAIPGSKGPGVYVRQPVDTWVIAALNCRLASYYVRSMTTGLDVLVENVRLLPLPEVTPDESAYLRKVVDTAVGLKRYLCSARVVERTYSHSGAADSLRASYVTTENSRAAVAAILHSLEGNAEKLIISKYGLHASDLDAVLSSTGQASGWYPLIAGYDAMPPLSPEVKVATELLASPSSDSPPMLGLEGVSALQRRLRLLYEAGCGANREDDEVDDGEGESDEEDENGITLSGARISIPVETFLEELSQKLEIHPISVYWLLRELRDEGVVSKPELVRFVEDYLSVLVLRLLGHRWPSELEGRELLAAWADQDGIVPITEATDESALVARVRARLASDFGVDRAGAIEREVQEITGKPLAAWLASDFFKRHISQFRKRPIAWQLTSSDVSNARRRGGRVSQNAPAFACLIYYHRLDTDLLPKLRTHYIGPLRTSLQTELGSLEKMRERSADQDARRLELEGRLEELKAFDARLEEVLALAFTSPTLDKIAAKEPLDKWTSRDGRARAPETRDAFLAQERRYEPDLNDGVRVNIAPLQRAGLVAADVLAAKDVEKAIADRAEWRADERRWCREGKLPQPGWWPVAAKALEVSGRSRGVDL